MSDGMTCIIIIMPELSCFVYCVVVCIFFLAAHLQYLFINSIQTFIFTRVAKQK